jgi:hypothetical protein
VPAYDLSALSEDLYLGETHVDWLRGLIVVAMFTFLSVAFALSVAVAAARGAFGPGLAPALALTALFAALGALTYWVAHTRSRRPATALEVGPDGLTFHYPNARPLDLVWSDHGFSLVIRQRGSPLLGTTVRFVRFRSRPTAYLTEEAVESIALAAHAVGLSVTWHTEAGSAGLEVIRIDPPPRGLPRVRPTHPLHGRMSLATARPFASARAASALTRRR